MLATLIVAAALVLSVGVLTAYVAPFVTLVTDLLVNSNASASFKAIVHIALGLISAAVTDAISSAHGLRLDNEFLASIVVTFTISALTYRFVTKPTGVSAKLQVVSPIQLGPDSLVGAVADAKKAA